MNGSIGSRRIVCAPPRKEVYVATPPKPRPPQSAPPLKGWVGSGDCLSTLRPYSDAGCADLPLVTLRFCTWVCTGCCHGDRTLPKLSLTSFSEAPARVPWLLGYLGTLQTRSRIPVTLCRSWRRRRRRERRRRRRRRRRKRRRRSRMKVKRDWTWAIFVENLYSNAHIQSYGKNK
jgi:hypothetical protein